MRILFLGFCLSLGLACASLQEAIDEFKQGDYARVREILEHDSYQDNIRAQLYFLAAQGFDVVERSPATISGLKTHVAQALESDRHKDHDAALLVKAFWGIYSENSGNLPRVGGDVVERQPFHMSVPRYGAVTDNLPDDTPAAMEEGRADIPLGAALDRIDLGDVRDTIHNAHYFPISDLFEGAPDIRQGIDLLKQLCEQRVHHAFYFLGTYAFSLDDQAQKVSGLGLVATASALENAESMRLMKQLMGQDLEPGWVHNFKAWFCCGGPACSKRCYCGGDATEKWFICNVGLCGCSSRWSLGELCFNAKNVTREGVGLTVAVAGFGLLITQQLAQNKLINLSDGWQNFMGWFGLFLSGSGVAASHAKKKE